MRMAEAIMNGKKNIKCFSASMEIFANDSHEIRESYCECEKCDSLTP